MKPDVNRRAFLGRLGAGVAGLSQIGLRAESPRKNVAWSAPPKLTAPNILTIMVDQMRWPQWLSAAQLQTLEKTYLPNIWGKIRNRSYVFQEYYTAATVCTAARATLLTGLYAPQTAVYTETDNVGGPQILLPAYPTWGEGVANLNSAYRNNVWWFGKWHLCSCNDIAPLVPYGFNTRTYPGGANSNPSPDGYPNEGCNGGPVGSKVWANDSEIAGDFIGWLKGQAPTKGKPATPWCATVSLINPHDIADAPSFPTTYFPKDTFPPPSGVAALYSSIPATWNYESDLSMKPPLQAAFQSHIASTLGPVSYPAGWVTFLNQYYWLQNYVDTQVGRVLSALAGSAFAANTIILFLADHGEYGGSHGLHDKGDAVYDETIRVPLYAQFPGQTKAIVMNQMCSSVDMFGLICDLATGGSGSWRTSYPDLSTRQSIWDFLYSNSVETRTVPSGPLAGAPYIFHTCDETALSPASGPNPHVVGLRTKSGAKPGGKLGVYSQWAPCTTYPDSTPQDFEFYDYTSNTAETGNDYGSSPNAPNYVSALGTWGSSGIPATGLVASELNKPLTGTGTDGKPLSEAQSSAQQNYFVYLGQSGCS